MTTDSGLVYLSGLLRAGAEPLRPAARAERRRAAVSPHAMGVSDHSAEDDAGQAAHASSSHASEGDTPAGADAYEDAEEAFALKSSEAAGDRHTPSPDVPPGKSAVNSLPDDAFEGVEQHVHAQIQSRAVTPSSGSVRAASEMNVESHIPAASPAPSFAGETERTAIVAEQTPVAADEGELINATRKSADVRQPPATLYKEPNASAFTQLEIAIERSARHASKAKTADEVQKKADEASDAHGASLLLPGASAARASQSSPEEGSPTFAGDRARVSEGGAELSDGSAAPAAGSAPFTLEAHVEQLRALMQTARARTPDEEGGAGTTQPPAVVASHHTKPLTKATRPAQEHPRAAPRPEFEPRPKSPTPAPDSGELQPSVLLNQEPPDASSSLGTSAIEARPTTPRDAWTQRGGASPTRVRGVDMTPAQSASVRTAGAPSDTQDAAPTAATNSARVVPAPSSDGASTGAASTGGRAPKLTINRLDVQVVGRHEPPPVPPPPATPAAESPPRADPWGALDRQLLGRFSY